MLCLELRSLYDSLIMARNIVYVYRRWQFSLQQSCAPSNSGVGACFSCIYGVNPWPVRGANGDIPARFCRSRFRCRIMTSVVKNVRTSNSGTTTLLLVRTPRHLTERTVTILNVRRAHMRLGDEGWFVAQSWHITHWLISCCTSPANRCVSPYQRRSLSLRLRGDGNR